MAKAIKITKNLTPMSKEEIAPILTLVAEALSNPRTIDERRSLVMSLLARKARRNQIVQIISKAFGVTASQIDIDIRIAKDKFMEWAQKTSAEQHMADSVATLDEVIQRGFRKDDLNAVVIAQKHRDTLFGLIDNDEQTRPQLGVVILPEKIEKEKWQKKFKKT